MALLPTIIGRQGFQTLHGGTSDGEGGGDPGVYDADPLVNGVQYRSIQIGGPEPEYANQDEGYNNPNLPRVRNANNDLAYLRSFGIEPINHPEYGWIARDDANYARAFPDRANSSIFDLGPFLLAAFMVPAIASSLAAAPAAGAAAGSLSDAAIADIVAAEGGYSALPSTGMAGTAAGGGLIGSGTEAVAEASGAAAAPETAPLSAGQEAAQSIAQEWGNYVDPWASGNAEAVANSGVAGDMGLTVESAATRAGDITDLAKAPTPLSNTQDAARKLVQSAEDVTSAEAGSGAWKAASGAGSENDIWTKIWNGVTSPQGTAAAITTIGGIASGIGAATLNRDTMLKKSELDLQNAEAMQQFRTNQSRANRFRGIIGVRPAATRAPLQRLTGGSVYNERGLIRRA